MGGGWWSGWRVPRWVLGEGEVGTVRGRPGGEGFEGLRRRMEGEVLGLDAGQGQGQGRVGEGGGGEGMMRRRWFGLGGGGGGDGDAGGRDGGVLDSFRGAF